MEENIQIPKYNIEVNLELTLALFQNSTFLLKNEPKLNVQIYIHTLVIF